MAAISEILGPLEVGTYNLCIVPFFTQAWVGWRSKLKLDSSRIIKISFDNMIYFKRWQKITFSI